MKKIIIILLFILLLSNISSLDIQIKQEYKKGEPFLAKISGVFLSPITEQDIHFYHNGVEVPLDFSLGKIKNNYYLFTNLPYDSGNYSIVLENILSYSNGKYVENDYVKNFTISNQTFAFQIDKGFITTSESFQVIIKNVLGSTINVKVSTGEDISIMDSITGKSIGNKKTLEILPGDEKKIYFSIKEINSSKLTSINFSSLDSFSFLVYLLGQDVSEEEKIRVSFSEYLLNISTIIPLSKTKEVSLKNTGNVKLENLTLKLSDSLINNINLSLRKIDSLDVNESISFDVVFFSDDEEDIYGEIAVLDKYNGVIETLPIEAHFFERYNPFEDEYVISNDSQNLNQENASSENQNSGSSSSSKIVIILIAIALIGVLWFYSKKYKGKSNFLTNLLFKKKQEQKIPMQGI